jgi:hypothetical protein
LELFKVKSQDHDLEEYKKDIIKLLMARSMDQNENVRAETIRAATKIYSKCKLSECKDIIVERLTDCDHKLRNLAIAFVEEHSSSIFSEGESYIKAILNLSDLTFDSYGSIRKKAFKCLRKLMMSKRKSLNEMLENMDSLLDHKAIRASRDILKTIVDALLVNAEDSGSDGIISQLFDGLFRKSIT